MEQDAEVQKNTTCLVLALAFERSVGVDFCRALKIP